MSENTVGTRDLKNRLSEYLRRVKAGETIIIIYRRKPIGQILPIQVELSSHLMKLEQAGVLEWNRQLIPPFQPKAVNRSEHLLSDLVAEERE